MPNLKALLPELVLQSQTGVPLCCTSTALRTLQCLDAMVLQSRVLLGLHWYCTYPGQCAVAEDQPGFISAGDALWPW